MKKTIGIVGCGAIGTALSEYADKNLLDFIGGIVIYDNAPDKVEEMSGKLTNAVAADSLDDIVDKSDLIIEAAVAKVVPDLLGKVIEASKDMLIMSVGGLLGNEQLLDYARSKGIIVMLPSGAIAGIDALKAAKLAGIESVIITTHKAPGSIKGAPYLDKNEVDVDEIKKAQIVFEGNALEAMKGFPKNINVSALLSIAGIGAEKTRVRIMVSPEYTRNIHEIEIKSKAGKFSIRTENVPSPANPKTSYLAALAAITSLKEYFDTVRIGT